MKQFNSFKIFLFVALLGAASVTMHAQNFHPYAFGIGSYQDSNWYKDYVGLNMVCGTPASLAGSYVFSFAYTGTTAWGGPVTSPLVNDTLKMAPSSDLYAATMFPAGYFNNRIAVVWRGPETGAYTFSQKASYAQDAGAIAIIILNEYAGEGPVGMAATAGFPVTIPVFMIGNIPGIALDSTLSHDTTVTMTISPWGTLQPNDLAIIPFGAASWENYAIPYDQLTSPTPAPYLGLDGAFVANFGTNTVSDVKMSATLTFNGSFVRADTTDVLPSFPTTDSIWAMFVPGYYPVTATTAGQFNLTYNVMGADINTSPQTVSFYATDSVYSKGAYDFVLNQPINSQVSGVGLVGSTGTGDFVWGNMYYVNNGGDAISAAQFSLFNGFAGYFLAGGSATVILFQWIDGSGGEPLDSFVEAGELHPVSLAQYSFNSAADSSSTTLKTLPLGTVGCFGDTISGAYAGGTYLSANSWYYLAVDVPTGFDIYCDGISNPYPRVFGRFNNANPFIDNANIAIPVDYTPSTPGNPGNFGTPITSDSPFPPTGLNGGVAVDQIDSFIFSETKGLVPSIAMIVLKTPPPPTESVKKVNANNTLNIFPIPTSDDLNVSINLEQESNVVTYTVLDGLGRFVSKQTHNNVTSEQFQIPTNNFASGTYFLVVTANGKAMSRTFVVAR